MNLKLKTVYIPDDKKATGVYHSSQESIPVRKHTDQICISKEELVELLSDAINFGWEELENGEVWKPNEEQFINNLFNQ